MIGFITANAAIIGLLFFFTFFIGVVIWTYRPGTARHYQDCARIPLKPQGNHHDE